MTREIIEQAIKDGSLFIHMANGAKWCARRNGKTQLWSSRPTHFSIPCKVGYRTCFRIDHTWLADHADRFTIDA